MRPVGEKPPPTVDQHGGRGAFTARHDVFGHAGVVAGVGQPGLPDHQVVVGRYEIIGVARRVEDILVSLPLHLKK